MMKASRSPAAHFRLAVRINYEDTDVGGAVYYGNYLGYMERARNAWLRQLGFSLTRLRQQYCMVFAVTEASLKYLSAARLDDEIELSVEIVRLKHASLVCAQRARRDGELLVDGEIKLATLNSDTYTPRHMPKELAEALRP